MNRKLDAQIAQYIRKVGRRLDLPGQMRARVISDFSTSIHARVEAGESVQTVLGSLGSPKAAAAELNEQMKEYVCARSPWRFVFLALGLVGLGGIAWQLVLSLMLRIPVTMPHSVGVIGGADGPTSVFIASKASPGSSLLGWCALLAVGAAGFLLLSRRRARRQGGR